MADVPGIDHPLVLVRDIEAASAWYRALGFTMTPVGFHPWGTSTCLAVLDRSLLEVMSVYDESLLDGYDVGGFRFGRHMQQALAEREGVSLVALYSTDAPGDRARAEARGIAAQGRVDFRRKVKIPGQDWDEAVVTLEMLVDPALPRASNFLCQQHKPHLVWVPEWMAHANTAVGFAGITYATAEPGPLLTRLGGLFGPERVRATAIGHEALTGNGVVRVVAPGVWTREAGLASEPEIAPATAACVGIDVKVRDLDAPRRILGAAGIATVEGAGFVTVADWAACGHVILRFVSA